nr:uncharacterized protein LOC129397626 isoform X1 [Pan paniscus]
MARDTNKGTRFHSADSNHSGSNSTSPPSVSKVTTQHVVRSFAQARRAFKPSPTQRGPALSLSLPVMSRERPVRAGAVGGPGGAVPCVTTTESRLHYQKHQVETFARCASFHNYWQWFNGFICFERFLLFIKRLVWAYLHHGNRAPRVTALQEGILQEENIPIISRSNWRTLVSTKSQAVNIRQINETES